MEGSPLTKTTRSARVLKISSRRLPRWASSVASLLMARLCAASIVMTTVRWSDWFAFWFGGGGWGTRASSPLGVTTDGGEHWTELTDANSKGLPAKPYGRIALAVAPAKPQVVYAMIESANSALFRSDDGGKTWARMDASQFMVWRPFYFANLIVDPKDENKIFKP